MPGLTRVHWLGDLIVEEAVAKAKVAIDEVTEAAAEDAARNHWWSNRTEDLAKNTISEPAEFIATEGIVRGRFGSSMRKEGFYGLFLERKTPWLRPAADRHFRELKTELKGLVRWT